MKKILSVVTAAVVMMTFTGCPQKDAKSSGPKGPEKEVLALYEKSKELNSKLTTTVTSARREKNFLKEEKLAEKWDIKTGSDSPSGTDEAGINDLAGVYIGYVPVTPVSIKCESLAYIYLGKNPDENGLYPALIYYTNTSKNFNYKEETSYKEMYKGKLSNPFTHIGSWSIERTVPGVNGDGIATVIRITLPEEAKRDWQCRLENNQPVGFTGESEWIHDLGHPYILDGKKAIVSIDGIYIKMD